MASSLKCERGTDRRTFASDAMSCVTFGPGTSTRKSWMSPRPRSSSSMTSLSFWSAGTSSWIVDGLLDERLGVRGRHRERSYPQRFGQPVEFARCMRRPLPSRRCSSPSRPSRPSRRRSSGSARRSASGCSRPGAQLPPERDLAEQLGISRSTLRQALTALIQSGHLVAVRGRGGGWFVADPLAAGRGRAGRAGGLARAARLPDRGRGRRRRARGRARGRGRLARSARHVEAMHEVARLRRLPPGRRLLPPRAGRGAPAPRGSWRR